MSNQLVVDSDTFVEARGFGEETESDVAKTIYKYTECGAWIQFRESGITIGSIVEGSNVDVVPHCLSYPFKLEDFDSALEQIESDADELWIMANEWEIEDE